LFNAEVAAAEQCLSGDVGHTATVRRTFAEGAPVRDGVAPLNATRSSDMSVVAL